MRADVAQRTQSRPKAANGRSGGFNFSSTRNVITVRIAAFFAVSQLNKP
jgi:hypothetical protein